MFLLHYWFEVLLVFLDYIGSVLTGNASMPGMDSFPRNDFLNTFQNYDDYGNNQNQQNNQQPQQDDQQQYIGQEDNDAEPERKYGNSRFIEDPEEIKARELRELSKVDLVRGNNPGSALRRTTKKLSSMMNETQIFDLQKQEQQRAQDLQHRAIEKVLLEQNKSKSKQTKEAQKLLTAISKAKETAFTVNEYSTHSAYLFEGYNEYAKRQTYA